MRAQLFSSRGRIRIRADVRAGEAWTGGRNGTRIRFYRVDRDVDEIEYKVFVERRWKTDKAPPVSDASLDLNLNLERIKRQMRLEEFEARQAPRSKCPSAARFSPPP